MKKLLALLICLCLAAGAVPAFAESAEESAAPFRIQETPLRNDGEPAGTMDLRFYRDAPSVAYIGIKAYMAAVQKLDVAVTPEEDGTWTIAAPNGKTLSADPAAGTLYAPDWAGFQTPSLPYVRVKTGIKDTDCGWTEVGELIYLDEPAPVTFDFAKYGIALYADGEDVYLPLALMADMLEDEALNMLAYNGDELFLYSGVVDTLLTFAPGYYEGEKIRALIDGSATREEDQIRESYAELCFILDYFYGHPGVAALDEAVGEQGLDAALDTLPDGLGESVRGALHSPDYLEYLAGINALFSYALSDGHSVAMTSAFVAQMPALFGEAAAARMQSLMADSVYYSMNIHQSLFMMNLGPQRQAVWGDATYREYGNTAIIRLDAFNPDEAGWHAWEEGKGEMPGDALGITLRGLERAAANPDIRNIIFDLTLNAGGSQDLMSAIIGVVTGNVDFNGYNPLTRQHMRAVYRVDRNMDGAIDAKDDGVSYDYNFGVLTTRMAFSCGNLFPFLMQEKGAVVIGEPTGGGSCVVQMMTLADGPLFLLSSYQWHLRDGNGNEVEAGAVPDIPLERTEITESGNPFFPRLVPGDYSVYYDDEMLDRLMNEWFARTEVPAA